MKLRTSRHCLLCVALLTLFGATPRVRWCPFGWDAVRIECFTPACAGERCEPEAVSSCGPAGAAAANPCETPRDKAASHPAGRAFCLGGSAGGPGVLSATPEVRPIERGAAIAPPRLRLPDERSARAFTPPRAPRPPGRRGSPPPSVRAPPSILLLPSTI